VPQPHVLLHLMIHAGPGGVIGLFLGLWLSADKRCHGVFDQTSANADLPRGWCENNIGILYETPDETMRFVIVALSIVILGAISHAIISAVNGSGE
jgi:hypothetical protein